MSATAQMPVAVVTGATGGIGKWIAHGLATAGFHTIIVGRDAGRTKTAASWLGQEVQGTRIETHVADLSSMQETRTLGQTLLATHPEIAVLVTNAGIFSERREVTTEGHEKVLAVNHLSPFLLANILLPALRRAPKARIITIGSDMSDRARINPSNLELTHGWNFVKAYRQSKLAQMMTIFELAAQLKNTNVTANVVHPGAVATGLVRAPGIIGFAWRLMAPFLLTEQDGAKTPLFAALSDNAGTMTGVYFKKCQAVLPNRRALDVALRRSVWRATEHCLESLI